MFDPGSLGVYVVTSGTLVAGRGHVDVAQAAIDGGASAIQLRAPELDDADLLPLARDLAERCRKADVLFMVNDRPSIALVSGADGAHVGQDDDLDVTRARLGPERILGVSVQDVEQAQVAADVGADYLGVTVWATPTKPDAVPLGLDVLGAVVRASGLPVVGIGGITADNARTVLEAGAVGVAVISAVAGAQDPIGATRELRAVFDRFRIEGDGVAG